MSETFDNANGRYLPEPPRPGGWLQKLLGQKTAPGGEKRVESETALPAAPAGIAKEIIEDISLCQLTGEMPEGTKFTALASLKGEEKGTRAFAYKNNKDANEVRLVFPGRSSGVNGTSTPAENSTVAAVVRGRHSYQLEVTEQWMQETVIPILKQHPGIKVKIFGHSMGSGNAIMAKHLLDKNNIASETLIIEPFAPTLAARFVLEKDFEAAAAKVTKNIAGASIVNGTPSDDVVRTATDEAKAEAVRRLQKGITSIRSYPSTGAALHPVGDSASNNLQFGQQAFFLTVTPQHTSQEGVSRRNFLATPVKAVMVPVRMISNGTLERGDSTDPGHELHNCKKALDALGDQAIQPAHPRVLSTPEQVVHPERYPVSAIYKSATQLAAGYYKAL